MEKNLLSDDLMAVDVIADPHAYYKELRSNDPVHWNERWGGWILTDYKNVVDVLRDPTHFSSLFNKLCQKIKFDTKCKKKKKNSIMTCLKLKL
jgi:cytochrome P450